MMKKIIVLICISVICLLFQGCWGGATDINVGKRPTNQGNARWVSENPDIYFEVSNEFYKITGSNTYGKITIDGAVTEILVLFDHGTTISFSDISEAVAGGSSESSRHLFSGRCKFSEDKLVVTIFNNEKGFLDESIKEITFVKESAMSIDDAQAILIGLCEGYKLSFLPDISKKVDGVAFYGFVLDYSSQLNYETDACIYCYTLVNAVTGQVEFQEVGPDLYSNIPDSAFPIPMRDGAVIPYDSFSPPDYVQGVTYVYADESVMATYKAQLEEAGFVEQGAAQSIESLWIRESGEVRLAVEMRSGDGLALNMYCSAK